MKPLQLFADDKQELRDLSTSIRRSGLFAVIHDHRKDYGCPGDCLMLNLPDAVRAELSTEV